MKISIIGTGVFSVSIANLLAQNKENKIVLWSENETLVNNYQKTNKMNDIFENVKFPKNITLTNSYEEALKNSELVLLMTSINYLENVCKEIKNLVNKSIPICLGTKGIYGEKQKFAYEIAKEHLANPLAVLSGPTFANDIINLEPIAFNIACKSKKSKNILTSAFNNLDVKISFTRDLIGTSLCGSIKNVYAIGSGIISGLGYHESTLAFYLTAVFKELENILYMYDSSLSTLHGLSGLGDLIATCNSPKSRNYTLGVMIGSKKTKKQIDAYKKSTTLEGLITLELITKLFTRKHIKAPIIMAIYKIVCEDENKEILISTINDMKLTSIY